MTVDWVKIDIIFQIEEEEEEEEEKKNPFLFPSIRETMFQAGRWHICDLHQKKMRITACSMHRLLCKKNHHRLLLYTACQHEGADSSKTPIPRVSVDLVPVD